MCLTTCEHPVRIHNPYINEVMYVPCGKCDVCKASRSSLWANRLEVESKSHRYTLFVTLTYAPEFLPLLRDRGDILVDDVAGLYMNKNDISYDDYYGDYYRAFGGIPYLRFADAQRFVKRLRQRVLRDSSNRSGEPRNDRYIRYFCCGEYGETTFRPHFHFLIYTSSRWLAENAKDVIASCWSTDCRASDSKQLGRIDAQIVHHSASCYVASYLNSDVHLPRFLRTSGLRPRAIFSKLPALGSLLTSEQEIQALFDSGSVTASYFKPGKNEFVESALPKQLCDRLYPKLPFFSGFSDNVLSSVYALASDVLRYSKQDFQDWIRRLRETSPDSRIRSYFDRYFEDQGLIYDIINESSSVRLFSVLRRVAFQSRSFGVSPVDYADRIFEFWKKRDYYFLTQQLQDEVELSVTAGPYACLLVDRKYIDEIRKCAVSSLFSSDYVTNPYLKTLISYGYDQDELSISDFVEMIDSVNDPQWNDKLSKARKLVHDYRKKRAKNDYLLSSQLDKEKQNLLIKIHDLDGIFETNE